ncbi:isopentenyl-diphosphate Delta-isomerase [Cellulosimicrobium cellulans]|uniref:Isopentenyl-diphosphate Delta-isomerase n=1 Tax=Cellulosimicrobium funkei TaxID=264251 RepID=A0A4Y8R8C3_9MICO|nr:isopentenyl-diphosphate Delta-isomerase [Cellulosimicrobium funkei]TFF17263.1 isopentenyl-diphosphate Delta-isomerase [Cellulosimicrobium funkei]TGA74210.1 isopentenyl-diphosphate Delta-isomerase [Cellulosimicrobium terreum]
MTSHVPVAADHVVTVDDQGRRTGTFERAAVHTTETPLHLAFSCYVLDDAGRLLLTRRALAKRTWPGVWTNSFCGHPRWTESTEESILRHARHELGLEIADLEVAVPGFRYRAVDASGVVENEICPVYAARAAGPVEANPDEVMELAWADPRDVARGVAATPWAFSPWMVLQVGALGGASTAGDGPTALLAAAFGPASA